MSQEHSSSSGGGDFGGGGGCGGAGDGEIMLFGVRLKVDPMRKSVSMNNLSQYQLPCDAAAGVAVPPAKDDSLAGYASSDEAPRHHSSTVRERKRGVPWTEEEHKLFLLGLQKVGKGDWRGISRNFVKTRTPTQVASHAQKYFLRRSNLNRRRRRTSLFDITTDSVAAMPMEESKSEEDNPNQPPTTSALPPMPEIANVNVASSIGAFPLVPFPALLPVENLTETHQTAVPVPTSHASVEVRSVNQRFPVEPTHLSLRLSLPGSESGENQGHPGGFQVMSSFSNGEKNIISVA